MNIYVFNVNENCKRILYRKNIYIYIIHMGETGMFSQSSAQSNYLSWFGLFVILHALGTAFLMGWSTIDDSMPNFLIATKLAHVIYLIFVAYYWVYAEAFMLYAKHDKQASSEFLNLMFGICAIGTICLMVVDGVVLGVKLAPTLVDCYRDPPNLPLPLECDYGNEKTVFTITTSVCIAHIVVEFVLLCLLGIIHTGISATYRRGEGFWYPFQRKGRKPTDKTNEDKEFMKDFQGQIGDILTHVDDSPTLENDTLVDVKSSLVQRLDVYNKSKIK